MSLEVNKNDASIDTRQMSKAKPMFQRTIAGLLTTLMLFSGSLTGPTKVYATETASTSSSQSVDYADPSTVIDIPKEYQYEIYRLCEKEHGEPITVGDLNNINDSWLSISVYDDVSLEWLNHIGSIEYLSLVIHAEDTSILQTLKSLKNVESVSIMSPISSPIEINIKDFAFLKDSPNTKKLLLSGEIAVEPGLLEQLTHLKSLSLFLQDGNHKYDCTKLGFLDELELYDPYTAAIYITQEEYDYLTKNGVNVSFKTNEELKVFKEINKRLDEIVEMLDISENSTEQEKLDAILCYVLDNLTYDPDVSAAIQNNESFQSLVRDFYQGGLLYGAIEKDTAICGNYAALTNALAERAGLDTYYLTSCNHAWSLVEVEGKQYYVDSTWLDGKSVYKEETEYIYDELGNIIGSSTSWTLISAADAIQEGKTEELEWYMEEPSSYPKSETQSESHIVVNLPSFYNINPQEESDELTSESIETPETTPQSTETIEETTSETETLEEETKPINLDDKEVEVRLGDKKWLIPAAAAIGILTAIGGAVAVKEKKEKQARERRRRQMEMDMMNGYDYGYGTTYDSFYGTPPKSPSRKRK